jgi:anti-sigma regulatory factor (Ser/Thr protein kinase)
MTIARGVMVRTGRGDPPEGGADAEGGGWVAGRTAAANRSSHVHEALFYESDDDLLKLVVPFVEEGLAASEPTLVVINDDAAELLRGAVGGPGLVFLDGRHRRHDPASRIAHHREIVSGHVAGGAEHVRVVGEVPHTGHGSPWDWWARYEATINHAYAELPLWNVCPYDLRITPADVVEDVTRTHPWLAGDGGSRVTNPRYQDPREFLGARPAPVPDRLEATAAPRVDLLDPTPAAARTAVRANGQLLPVGAFDLDDVVMCVNEVVTNALAHGRPPVRLRLWSTAERIVVSVSDRGPGPGDPFVGLLPGERSGAAGAANGGSAGLGLWIAHQMASHVTLDSTGGGFTVRLVFDAARTGR